MPHLTRLASLLVLATLQGCLLVAPGLMDPQEAAPDGTRPAGAAPPSGTPSVASAATPAPPQGGAVKVLVSPGKPVMEPDETVKLIAEVHMADGEINGNVAWSSSDDTIATVNATSGEVKAVREGRVTIRAVYAPDPKVKGLAELTIVKDKSKLAPSAPPEGLEAVAPPPSAPPSGVKGSVIAAPEPGATNAPGARSKSFSGPLGEQGILGPVLLTAGIHNVAVTHSTTFGGLFQLSIYTADGLLGENLYSGVGGFAVSFPYMVYQTGWYYLAVEQAAGAWSLTID